MRNGGVVTGFIFDLDGTLIDSEPLCEAAWANTLASFGSRLTTPEARWSVGKTSRECALHFAATRPALPEPQVLTRCYMDALSAGMAKHLRTFRDARVTVEWLRLQGIPVGIATNSSRARVNNSLMLTNPRLPELPSTAADEVARPKPAPDVYLRTAEKLGVPAQCCIAVEDSDVGQQSAIAAGMQVIRVDQYDRNSDTLLRQCQQLAVQ
ncbi:HAD family phosphatase [Arthrobacter sp. M2012083]